MDTLGIIFTVVLVIAAIVAGMYFLGKYLQKKQAESQQLIDQNRQKITAFIIDKKKAKVSEANFPIEFRINENMELEGVYSWQKSSTTEE